MTDTSKLDDAYDLNSDADHRALYRDWARTYDTEFAATRDFRLPALVARAFLDIVPHPSPVLDIGAGTGLLAAGIATGAGVDAPVIDALDLSKEMLAIAAEKRVYRDLHAVALADHRDRVGADYAAVVSSGAFTHGHLGPDALAAAFALLRPGGHYVLSINAAHYHAADFAAGFARLDTWVTAPTLAEVAIYGTAIGDDHDHDTAYIAVGKRHPE